MDFKKNLHSARGFSLLEMLVSISIIMMILAVVVLNQGDFVDQFSLSSNVSDLELQIRQAQIYGISVKEFMPASGEFTSPYGVSVDGTTSDNMNYYITFADRGTSNGTYDSGSTCPIGGTSECIGKFMFTKGVKIYQVCALNLNGNSDCSPTVGRVDITFVRPDPEAHLQFYNIQGNLNNSGSNAIGTRIDLVSPKGKIKSIFVYTTGQIAVQ